MDRAAGNDQIISDDLIIHTNQKIGNGAFGMVFKGTFKDKPCAVKVLLHVGVEMLTSLPADGGPDNSIKAFDRECEFLKSFLHPNVVQHLSTEKHPKTGSTILVTELMDCSLRTYLPGIEVELHTLYCQISLSKDVASGLAYIHSRNVIHRDLCGDNILLNHVQPVPRAKISDFGMSRILDPSSLSSSLTSMGHRQGYLPPEAPRIESERYDHSLDVFSLGVIMIQIIHRLATVKSRRDRLYHFAQTPETHQIKPLIKQCIQEDMSRRPTASVIYTLLDKCDT